MLFIIYTMKIEKQDEYIKYYCMNVKRQEILDMVYEFASTSKVTFSGSGDSCNGFFKSKC